MFDFLCALGAGCAYVLLFSFLTGSVGLPHWVLYGHLALNFLYGFFGLWIFLSGRMHWFKTLAYMNVGYLVPCFIVAGLLIFLGRPWACGLVVIEGLFVGLLGTKELLLLKNSRKLAGSETGI